MLGRGVFPEYAPFACAEVASRVEQQWWRASRPDTITHPPDGDWYRPATIDSVRACVSRFAVSAVEPRDLLGLGRASLDANDDARAAAAFARLVQLGTAKPVAERAWDLLQIVSAYATASPNRLDSAVVYMTRLDSFGSVAAPERVMAHVVLARRAGVRDSLPMLDAQANAAVGISESIQGDARREWAWQIADAYGEQADAAGRRGDAERALAILQHALVDLGPLRASLSDMLNGEMFPYTLLGKPSPRVAATYWYVADTVRASTPLVSPVPGKVTLIALVSKDCGALCATGYTTIRHLASTFDTTRVQITLVTATSGWDRDAVIANAADEARIASQFFHGYAALPCPLAIWATDFGKRADGHRVIRSAPNERAFGGRPDGIVGVVVDRHGIVRAATVIGPAMETRLTHVISDALRSP